MNQSLKFKKERLCSEEVKTTKRYIEDIKLSIEARKNPKYKTGILSLVAHGPRDWKKRGETDEEYYNELYNYYFPENTRHFSINIDIS